MEQERSDTAASRLDDQQGCRKDIAGGTDHDKRDQPPREPGSVEDLTHFGDGADKIRPTAGERPGPQRSTDILAPRPVMMRRLPRTSQTWDTTPDEPE